MILVTPGISRFTALLSVTRMKLSSMRRKMTRRTQSGSTGRTCECHFLIFSIRVLPDSSFSRAFFFSLFSVFLKSDVSRLDEEVIISVLCRNMNTNEETFLGMCVVKVPFVDGVSLLFTPLSQFIFQCSSLVVSEIVRPVVPHPRR